MASAGGSALPWAETAPSFAAAAVDLKRRGFAGPLAVADARPVHDAGGSEAQELAFAIAAATAYLRALETAGLGGADSVTVLPFTAALGLPDRFARRLARNTQLVLLEEANLAKVADPAAGTGAMGYLTGQL